MTTPSQIALRSEGEMGECIEPKTIGELAKLAEIMAKSMLVPKAMQGKPHDCLLVMMTGRELGFSYTASLQMFNVVQGRVSAGYEACLAMIQRNPQCADCRSWNEGEGDEFAGCVQTTRRGRQPNPVIRFTMADAKRAGLTGGENWKKYPGDMLIAKAAARSKRRDWPDIAFGVQVREDLEGHEPVNVTPARVPAEQRAAHPLLAAMPGREGWTLPKQTPDQIAEAEKIAREAPPGKIENLVDDRAPRLADLTDAIKRRVEKEVAENPDLPRIAYGNALRKAIAARYPDLADDDDRLYDAVLDAERMEIVVPK